MEPEENRTGRRWNLPLILLLILAATALFSVGTGRRTGSGTANTESKNAEQAANVGNEADDSSLRSDAEAVNSYGAEGGSRADSENCGDGDGKNNPGKDLCFGLRGSAS